MTTARILLPCAVIGACTWPAQAGLLDGVGAMGDSLTDEYTQQGLAGLNWVEQLIASRGADFGAFSAASRGEPRRSGYAYNWGRGGATSATVLSQGQHTGLAGQVAAGDVTLAYLGIGANDFTGPLGASYSAIYTGILTGPALDTFLDGVAANVETAIDTVLLAGDVKMVLGNIPDVGNTPIVRAFFPDPAGRQRATDAIAAANARLDAIAAARSIPVMDLFGLANEALAGTLTVGGLVLDVTAGSDDPHHLFLADGFHPGTIAHGIFANAFLDAINTSYDAGVPLLTDREILIHAGIPEPATLVLLGVGVAALHAAKRRSRARGSGSP